ncbi:hypothetical protein Baya_16516 [Bagarius yarrelli]|uniref:Uncharacterized protein n=1 Tax=Bagarius yarrelli TaxID=175774 RepID=A0A556VVS6_BAGYA|nr:hypothetical protein Baya_16516 [Bagarius yarrelli]
MGNRTQSTVVLREDQKDVKQDYKEIKNYNRVNGSNQRSGKWFERLDMILGERSHGESRDWEEWGTGTVGTVEEWGTGKSGDCVEGGSGDCAGLCEEWGLWGVRGLCEEWGLWGLWVWGLWELWGVRVGTAGAAHRTTQKVST